MHPFQQDDISVDHLQFAGDGDWEAVEIVEPGNIAQLLALTEWLENAPRDLAAEALFLDNNRELDGFFGVRTNEPASSERTLAWTQFALQALESLKAPFKSLTGNCLKALGFPPTIPQAAPSFEIGIFNFWNSAEPIKLGTTPIETLEQLLKENRGPKWLREGHQAPICFEYVWHQPTHIWVARNASSKSGDRYFLDLDLVKKIYSSTHE